MEAALTSRAAEHPPIAALVELAGKYDRLLALAPESLAGRTPARRDALRTLAERFPTALREWDALPRAELLRRAQVAAPLRDAETWTPALAALCRAEPWLAYAADLHAHLRSLLALRRYLVTRPLAAAADDPARCAALWDSPLLGPDHDDDLLARVRRPPGGSLTALAYAEVAARHQVSVAALKRALFQPALAASPLS